MSWFKVEDWDNEWEIDDTLLTNEALFNLVNTILSCSRNNNTTLMIEFLQLLDRYPSDWCSLSEVYLTPDRLQSCFTGSHWIRNTWNTFSDIRNAGFSIDGGTETFRTDNRDSFPLECLISFTSSQSWYPSLLPSPATVKTTDCHHHHTHYSCSSHRLMWSYACIVVWVGSESTKLSCDIGLCGFSMYPRIDKWGSHQRFVL